MGGVPESIKGKLRQANSSIFHYGLVMSVDSSKYTIDVKVFSEEGKIAKGIFINQTLTYSNSRNIMMPIPNKTYAILAKADVTESGFIHLGYYLPDGDQITADKENIKTGDLIYQRYLKAGEYQIVSISGTELYMPDNGDFFVRNSKGYFVKLNNYLDNLEMYVPDVIIYNYSVDVKSGRVNRISSTSYQNEIKRNTVTYEPYKEFSINIGTMYSIETQLPTGVSLGSLIFSDRVFDVTGENPVAYEGASSFLQFLLELMSGIRISIDETGDFCITNTVNNSRFKIGIGQQSGADLTELLFKTATSEFRTDRNNFSFVQKALGYFIKFNVDDSGVGSLSMRMGDNTITLDSERGLQINQQSGAGIIYGSDGSLIINDKNNHTIVMSADGIVINGNSDPISVAGNILNISTEKGLMVGFPTDDGLLKAQKTATAFDMHVHAGPSGPPVKPWTPQVLTTLMAKGIKVG